MFFILISINIKAQFTGQSGIYYLGTADVQISTTIYNNQNISGTVIRFTWNNLENTPDNFNWAFIDSEISKANTYNKKISLQPLGTPNWLDSIGAKQYYYLDKNKAHTTYGKVISNTLPWDSIYISRYKNLLLHLAYKYSSNSTVSYINAIGVALSRNLPDTILTDTIHLIQQPFWTTYKYNSDTFGLLMNQITDYYMSLFPTTPLWCSVDYVIFQTKATGQPANYLASIYCNYGISNYSDRFGLYREDISACNPPSTFNSGSQWYIMNQNHCRVGAQMLWNVQDGPTRMNTCGITPNTKSIVLDSAINKGLSFGMRYLEIYGVDISDLTLTCSIQQANINLLAKGLNCNSTTEIIKHENEISYSFSPNPATDFIYFKGSDLTIKIYNLIGVLVKSEIINQNNQKININDLTNGIYLVSAKSKEFTENKKLIIQR